MSDEKAYVIAVFDDGVQLVPRNWIVGGSCYWPAFKSNSRYEKAVKCLEEANPEWPLYPVRILASFETYDLAKSKLKLAEEFSDLNSDGENMKKNRAVRKRKVLSSDSESDFEPDNLGDYVRKLPKPPAVDVAESSSSSNIPLQESKLQNQPSSVRSYNEDCCAKLARDVAKIKVMVNDILNIMTKNSTISSTVPTAVSANAESCEVLHHLPLKSTEEVKDFDRKLSLSNEDKQNLVQHFSLFGGSSVDVVVKSILKRLITNDVAAAYSWLGGKKKEVFSSLNLSEVVIRSVRGNFPEKSVPEKEIVNSIKNWLRHGKARALNAARRNDPGTA